jgi:hypothetical protein
LCGLSVHADGELAGCEPEEFCRGIDAILGIGGIRVESPERQGGFFHAREVADVDDVVSVGLNDQETHIAFDDQFLIDMLEADNPLG